MKSKNLCSGTHPAPAAQGLKKRFRKSTLKQEWMLFCTNAPRTRTRGHRPDALPFLHGHNNRAVAKPGHSIACTLGASAPDSPPLGITAGITGSAVGGVLGVDKAKHPAAAEDAMSPFPWRSAQRIRRS